MKRSCLVFLKTSLSLQYLSKQLVYLFVAAYVTYITYALSVKDETSIWIDRHTLTIINIDKIVL